MDADPAITVRLVSAGTRRRPAATDLVATFHAPEIFSAKYVIIMVRKIA